MTFTKLSSRFLCTLKKLKDLVFSAHCSFLNLNRATSTTIKKRTLKKNFKKTQAIQDSVEKLRKDIVKFTYDLL